MKYEQVKTEKLIPYVNNARKHSEAQVAQIAASIKEFGFISPIIIDKTYGVICGHGRLLGAQKLGLKEVPCLRVEHLTETQKKAYILADNRLSETATWDNELLALELEDLKLEGFDLELAGFDSEFLDKLSPFEMEIEPKERTGAKELGEEEFSEFDNTCPRCGFEFDKKE
jgi:ParB-like chromosome segregation protein Spo0J